MSDPSRYAVPVAELEAVRVQAAEQLQAQRLPAPPEAGLWVIPLGDGGDVDGDGD